MKQIVFLLFFALQLLQADPISLQVVEKKALIDGKEATIYALVQPGGDFGLRLTKGEPFDVLLSNQLPVPTSIHWHGVLLPNGQDGVAFVTQFPSYPGQSYRFQFPITQAGTFWMHAHYDLQEQKLLAAPLILLDPEEELVYELDQSVLISDFSWKDPANIFEEVKMSMKPHKGADLFDYKYDALLANYQTLSQPQIIQMKPGETIRLRLINGACSTNCLIDLGNLSGEAVATDGNRIQPFKGNRFELAVAQRIDLLIRMKEEGGSFPILIFGEGTDLQTGVILSTKGAKVPRLKAKALNIAPALTNKQEGEFHALNPLTQKPVDRRVVVELAGTMSPYRWTLNGQAWPNVTPILIQEGERVEMTFVNKGGMGHPMHLHGHVFQVSSLGGNPIQGPKRDTVYVPPKTSVTILFDADSPGVWPLHCHLLYHQAAGMLTLVRYEETIQPLPEIVSFP